MGTWLRDWLSAQRLLLLVLPLIAGPAGQALSTPPTEAMGTLTPITPVVGWVARPTEPWPPQTPEPPLAAPLGTLTPAGTTPPAPTVSTGTLTMPRTAPAPSAPPPGRAPATGFLTPVPPTGGAAGAVPGSLAEAPFPFGNTLSPTPPASPVGVLDGLPRPVCVADLAAATVAPPPHPPMGTLKPLPPDPFAGTTGPFAWGIVGLRGFPYGESVASNGLAYNQLFSMDLSFNMWVWRPARVYLFSDSRFWGQKANPDVTNGHQGAFDFSKRELDITMGVAWNYYGFLELRAEAYAFNNINRGNSQISPSGFNDGVGIENRFYINPTYAVLGTPAFDLARATFVSIGYYPSKSMVDGGGQQFKPGIFARGYFIYQILGPRLYLYTDDQIIAANTYEPKLFYTDSGVAVRPLPRLPRLEFRLGTEDTFDLQGRDVISSVYFAARFIY